MSSTFKLRHHQSHVVLYGQIVPLDIEQLNLMIFLEIRGKRMGCISVLDVSVKNIQIML